MNCAIKSLHLLRSCDEAENCKNSAEEDIKVETGPENSLFWLRRLD